MQSIRLNPIYLLFGLIVPLFVLFLFIRFAKVLWIFGMFLVPVLLLVTYFINPKPITDYAKMLGATFYQNPIKGLFYTVLTVLGLPILAFFFLAKAIILNKVQAITQQPDGFANFFTNSQDNNTTPNVNDTEYSDYEEIETVAKTD